MEHRIKPGWPLLSLIRSEIGPENWTLPTKEIQNEYHSWLGQARFPALLVACLFCSHWLKMMLSFVVIDCNECYFKSRTVLESELSFTALAIAWFGWFCARTVIKTSSYKLEVRCEGLLSFARASCVQIKCMLGDLRHSKGRIEIRRRYLNVRQGSSDVFSQSYFWCKVLGCTQA